MAELKKVMLIDDEDDIREVAKMALELVGELEVLCCESGEKGIAGVDEFSPDVILLDWMMPAMDGPDVFKKLREQGCEVPVIFMTAKVQKEEVDALMALGARGVISKPFDPMSLTEKINELWAI